MLFAPKAADLTLLSLGLANGRQVAAVNNCLDLITETADATGFATTTATLEADIVCEAHIEISTTQDVEITSAADTGPHTLTIGTLFAGDAATKASGGASLIVNVRTLTINGMYLTTESFDGSRAVYNTGKPSAVDSVMFGDPDSGACPWELMVAETTFSGYNVDADLGGGGSLAIIEASATLTECVLEGRRGTALVFESSSSTGEHQLEMASCPYNESTDPSEANASSFSQVVETGNFFNMFCIANNPLECEFVHDGAKIFHEGEFKCQRCDIYETTGLALLALGLAARQSAAVETCLDLISAVQAATGTATTTVTLEADITCETRIEIATSQNLEIASAATGPYTMTIGTLFAGAAATEQTGAASLILNEGTLTINGVNFANAEGGDGNRAIHNTGTLSVVDSVFNLFHDGAFIDEGGAVFSDSSSTVDITGCTFTSNVALLHGGAMYVGGSETLTITGSTFSQNEVGLVELGTSSGGDLWISRTVELTVEDSVFSGSAAEYGGAAIVCCGATIAGSNFSSTDVFSTSRHFGAVLVGGPDEDACPRALTITNSVFSGCSVDSALGEGGSLAVFDTTAELTACTFEASVGTAILFESSSADGEHKLDMTSCQFNENTGPSEAYASSVPQGSAVVMTNTGVSDGDLVEMGTFFNMFCFANVPYECEFVYDGAEIVHEGEFKCHICDIDGTRLATGLDDDLLGATDRSVTTDSSDDNDDIVIGLAIVAGLLALVVIGGFTAWRCKKSPRSASATVARPAAPATGGAAAPTAPPATDGVPAATAPPGTESVVPATPGTVEPATQA
eukprot:g10561.t1